MINLNADVDVQLDDAAVNDLVNEPVAQQGLRKAAEVIMENAKVNLASMGAVKSGKLRDSGVIAEANGEVTVEFTATYAAQVHEGDGTSLNKGPRPFLAEAAYKDQGRL